MTVHSGVVHSGVVHWLDGIEDETVDVLMWVWMLTVLEGTLTIVDLLGSWLDEETVLSLAVRQVRNKTNPMTCILINFFYCFI